jgi:hypothetical protein
MPEFFGKKFKIETITRAHFLSSWFESLSALELRHVEWKTGPFAVLFAKL